MPVSYACGTNLMFDTCPCGRAAEFNHPEGFWDSLCANCFWDALTVMRNPTEAQLKAAA